MRTVALPEREPVKLVFDPEYTLTEEGYLAFCQANPEPRCERTAEAEIAIAPSVGGESAYRGGRASCKLGDWADGDGHGKAID